MVVDSLLDVFVGDGIIIPTNSYGLMSEGPSAQIKAAAGDSVEQEARRCAPIAVGAAVVTDGGKLVARKIIHVPVMEQPGMRIGIENVRRATRAGLLAADHFQLEHIAMPGIGFGENGIPYDETARAIFDEIRAFKGNLPLKVSLIDTDPEMLTAFKQIVTNK